MADASKVIMGLIISMLGIVVGTNLVPTVANDVYAARNSGNVTGGASSLLALVTLIFVVVVVITGVGAIVSGVRGK